jgi:hypothetical protein
MELEPNNSSIFYFRGQTLEAMKRVDESIENYSKAIELDVKART